MLNFSNFKILLIALPCVWALYGAVPHFNYSVVEKSNDARAMLEGGQIITELHEKSLKSWPVWLSSKLINLGLDLRGGAHLLVEVTLEDVHQEHIDGIWPEIRKSLRKIRAQIGSVKRIESSKGSLSLKIEKEESLQLAIKELKKLNSFY